MGDSVISMLYRWRCAVGVRAQLKAHFLYSHPYPYLTQFSECSLTVTDNSFQQQPSRNSSMHKCLGIAELFDRICRWALVSEPHEWPITGKSTLAALCRTCHLFHDPALDTLYKSLESLHPLLSCIPTTIVISEGQPTIVGVPP